MLALRGQPAEEKERLCVCMVARVECAQTVGIGGRMAAAAPRTNRSHALATDWPELRGVARLAAETKQ